VVALQLIEMIGHAIYLHGRILDRLGRAIGGLGRFVRGGLRLRRSLFGVLGRLLRSDRGGLSLLCLLLVAGRASRKSDRKDEHR
jgi:hypothetical protein